MSVTITSVQVEVPDAVWHDEPVGIVVYPGWCHIGGGSQEFHWNPDTGAPGPASRWPLTSMPFFDAVFRHLVDQHAANRGNPVGEFLAPCVTAMEAYVAARDGSSVYFAASGPNWVKIGWSKQVATRIAQLQTGSPSPIRLLATTPGGRGLERRLHEQFASARVNGEWFELTPALREYIEALV